ncbi:uncharacterized protein LOC127751095 [Frankliniella occidentalis]|uniref:Uncharacterized protein LOC127751095 n=1 Tax=Frankliniella occidentalis TaxID=133901 RepID=A0A9C6X6L2_FRAOC|nr:uncharacterized protein LOC127751095 [Frankliniella occidentalis]
MRSTTDSLALLTTNIHLAFRKKEFAVSLFADISGAYPNVNPQLLCESLTQKGLPAFVIENIRSSLMRRKLKATYGGILTDFRYTSKGLNQGDIWSPFLYILFTSDLREVVTEDEVLMLQYADDISLTVRHSSLREAIYKLQDAARNLEEKISQNGATLEPTKSQMVIFTRKTKIPEPQHILLRGGEVPIKKEAKFLGITMDPALNWKTHVANTQAKCRNRLKFIRSLTGHWWGAHPMTLKRTYTSLIRPMLDYGIEIYDPHSQEMWAKLESIQMEAARIITGAMKSTPRHALLAETGEMPIQLRQRYHIQKSLLKWQNEGNNIRTQTKYRHPLFRGLQDILVPKDEIFSSEIPLCYYVDYDARDLTIRLSADFPPENTITAEELEPIEIYNKLRQDHWKNFYVLATDGSRQANETPSVGSAMVDVNRSPEKAIINKLHSLASVYDAEIRMLQLAVNYLPEIENERKILILTDSKSLVAALHRRDISPYEPPELTKLRESISNIPKHKDIWIAWVPAHKSILPNEHADVAAKLAATMGLPHKMQQRYQNFLPEVRTHFYNEWQQLRCTAANHPIKPMGRFNLSLDRELTSRTWISLADECPRIFLSPLMRVRMGHTHAPASLHRFGIIDCPFCDRCGEEATKEHLINSCQFIDRLHFFEHLQENAVPEPHTFPSLLKTRRHIKIVITAFALLFEHNPHLKL